MTAEGLSPEVARTPPMLPGQTTRLADTVGHTLNSKLSTTECAKYGPPRAQSRELTANTKQVGKRTISTREFVLEFVLAETRISRGNRAMTRCDGGPGSPK